MKILSYILRHDKTTPIDENGWCDTSFILDKLNISFSQLEDIIVKDNKGRFGFNTDKTKIRANQGHSIDIKVDYNKVSIDSCPDVLYHGTPSENLDSIFKNGIKKMNRTHVHLSKDYDTAVIVAKRYKKDYTILEIDAKSLIKNEYIYLSENDVYLCDFVPSIYIKNKT